VVDALVCAQVPEDLSVAVNMLIEKYITEVAESRKESFKGQSDRNTLIAEVNTLTEEKVRMPDPHLPLLCHAEHGLIYVSTSSY
jgi:hypothetical protein